MIQLPPKNKTVKKIVCPTLTNAPVKFIPLETFEKGIPAKYIIAITNEVTTCTTNCPDNDPHMTATRKMKIPVIVAAVLALVLAAFALIGTLSPSYQKCVDHHLRWTPKMRQLAKVEPCP